MRTLLIVAAAACISLTGCTDVASETESSGAVEDNTERNKRLAREFYENLWFEQNTEVFADYVADEYVIHDIGDTKGAMPTEPAVTQKEIADRFHSFGKMTGDIDYQIAEGDKVATRWFIYLEPNDAAKEMGFTPVNGVPIINVFRFNEDGKITEIWNHRHDVSLPRPPGGSRPN